MSTNQPYVARSMNGIITIDDGAGGTMEDGVVTCNDLETPRISVDQIQSKTVGANVSLFTELVGGSIHLANGATTLFVDAPTTIVTTNVTNLNATNISTNNIVSAAVGTVVNLFSNQSAGITLGSSVTFGAMTIGGASQNGILTVRTNGTMNLGLTSAIVNIGTTQTVLKTINIGNLGITNVKGSELNVFANMYVNNINASTSSSTGNLFTNVSTGILNIGTQMYTTGTINIGKQSEINFSQSTLNIGGGANVSNLFCDNFRHEVYGTNVSLLLEEFGSGASIQMGNVSNPLIIYAPTTIVDTLKAQTIIASNSSSTGNLYTNISTGTINIGTQMHTLSDINIGKQGLVNFSNSTLNIGGGANVSNLFCDNFRHEVYGTNVSLLLEEFGTGATIQMGNVSNRLIIYAPTTIVDSLKTQTIISPNPTLLSELFANNTSGNVSIATGLTTGVLTLGSAGVVDIKGSSVNISTLNTSTFNVSTVSTDTITATATSSFGAIFNNITTGQIRIGNNASFTEIGANATVIELGKNAGRVEVCNLRMSGSEIRTKDFASVLTIGGANMSTTQTVAVGTSQENVYLGSVTATAKVFVGDFKFTSDTVNLMVGSVPNVSGTMAIANALTVGSLQLGTGLTTGNVSIGNGTMTGNINIRTTGALLLANSASSIELGTGASVTNNINLGNVSTTINAVGSAINIGNTSPNTIIIGNDTTGANSLILRTLGTISIGLKSFAVNIGTGAVTNTIGIGNASTTINALGFTINIGATTSSTINVVSSAINIGANTQTNTITVGNVSTTSLTLNTPINPNYDTKYTLNSGTPSGCIGNYFTADVNLDGVITSGTAKHMNTFTALPIGVWMLYYQQLFTVPTTNCALTSSLQLRMGTTSTGAQIGISHLETQTQIITVGDTKSCLYTQIYTQTSAVDVFFNIFVSFSGTLSASPASILYVKALRLA